MQRFSWVVPDSEQGSRLDVFCAKMLKYETRSQVKAGMQYAKVNGKDTKLSRRLKPGELVELGLKKNTPDRIYLLNYPLKIFYEDANIIVLAKPSGMVSHLAGGHYRKTLVNALEYHRRKASAIVDEFSLKDLSFSPQSARSGIVHRLDKDTSGLMITVRNEKAKEFYIGGFKSHRIKKYYIAILNGYLEKPIGLIKTGITRSTKNRQKFIATDENTGKIAISKYKVLQTFNGFSLVVFRIYTGRTHQIRVHSKLISKGIVGDTIYTKDTKNPLMLHAFKLEFTTQDNKVLSLKTKIPKRFAKFIKKTITKAKPFGKTTV